MIKFLNLSLKKLKKNLKFLNWVFTMTLLKTAVSECLLKNLCNIINFFLHSSFRICLTGFWFFFLFYSYWKLNLWFWPCIAPLLKYFINMLKYLLICLKYLTKSHNPIKNISLCFLTYMFVASCLTTLCFSRWKDKSWLKIDLQNECIVSHSDL